MGARLACCLQATPATRDQGESRELRMTMSDEDIALRGKRRQGWLTDEMDSHIIRHVAPAAPPSPFVTFPKHPWGCWAKFFELTARSVILDDDRVQELRHLCPVTDIGCD